jgi:hypothetical protein
VTWAVKPNASLADLATIDLRRITDVLQVDHASLFLRDPDDPQRAAVVAETGLPVAEALPEHRMLLTDVLQSGCAAELQCPGSETGPAAPRSQRRSCTGPCRGRGAGRNPAREPALGAIDAQVIQRATRALVERLPAARRSPRVPRGVRALRARRRRPRAGDLALGGPAAARPPRVGHARAYPAAAVLCAPRDHPSANRPRFARRHG